MPFTTEQFLNVFADYNNAVWPLQIIFNLIAVTVIFFSINRTSYSNIFVNISLAFLWLWMGVVYHMVFFSAINKAAYLFGFLFIIQGLVFLFIGGIKGKLSYGFSADIYSWAGIILILYALIIYSVLGYRFGHIYPGSPTFGLPCPTTIFTFGMLLFTDRSFPKYVLILPFVWSVIGFFAALNFGIYEDTGLLAAGIIASALLITRGLHKRANL